jgi:NitT/TauT family transport system ATP-binding protein
MIEIQRLTFAYSDQEIPVFDGFSWSLNRLDTCAVLGPSGCGKTSLLYLLAGLRIPQEGIISVAGEKLIRPRPQTGLILQDYGLLPWVTVRKNVSLGLEIRNFYGPDGKHAPINQAINSESFGKIQYWLDELGLSELADKYPGQLSGGQRQRTAIARTLVLEPDLLLMDEPFSSLDAPTRENLQQQTLNLCHDQGITLVLVTHSIEEAAFMGKKILLLQTPPNQKPIMIHNPSAGVGEYRNSREYQELCINLRDRMGEK